MFRVQPRGELGIEFNRILLHHKRMLQQLIVSFEKSIHFACIANPTRAWQGLF
jgi:hypothetical protein